MMTKNAVFVVSGKVIVSSFADDVDVLEGAQSLLTGGTLPAGAELVATSLELPVDYADQEWLWVNGELVKDQTEAARRMEAKFTMSIQRRLDSFARKRNYDGILSACTYATSSVSKFKNEGQVCVSLRDATWAAAYEILAEVQAGQRPMPGSIEDIDADLPMLKWPT